MKPYIDMYRRWIAVSGIQAADIAVLSALYAHADRDGVCTATQGELAEELGQSRAWFNAVLKGLQEKALQDSAAALVCAKPRRGLRGFAYQLAGMEGVTAVLSCQPADSSGSPAGFSLDSQNPESSFSSPGGGMVVGSMADGSMKRQDEALPADWQPEAADLAWAVAERPEVDAARVTAKFVSWCRKAHRRNGYRPPDPGAAWRRWIARELVAPAEPAAEQAGKPAAAQPSVHSTAPQHRREPRHDRRSSPLRAGPASDAVGRNRETLAALRLRLAGQA
ncbi:MarR family transcriptional regulator [Azospirillum sp. YIM B02556]|uniref:MarR family transcriptional regulator n=1 Tax=Azospirillum endophyticum TaxID=2800326 RepID=A0ABS1FA82_9PROT|nr:helix-turn-helix domain-containing protein [Azospirillum endophyticum]MBK1840282.1 MarR family transcriptional regulator [Azospirillum endophyticum]